MPNNIKAGVSVLALLVAIAFAYYESTTGRDDLALVAVITGVFMVLAMWIFPEHETHNAPKKKSKS